MARPSEISDLDIIAAGRRLKIAGTNITGYSLRQEVGSGNPARLKKVWDDSKDLVVFDGPGAVEKISNEIPADLAQDIEIFTAAVVSTVTDSIESISLAIIKNITIASAKAATNDMSELAANYEKLFAIQEEKIRLQSDRIQKLKLELAQLKVSPETNQSLD